jgi:hypothetical protein
MNVTTAMRRIADVDKATVEGSADREQQHEMYRKSLSALVDVDGDDDDEGVMVVTEWIIDEIEETGKRPSSKAVRRRARDFCEQNGYELSDNSWLGE